MSQQLGQGERLSRICDWMCESRGGLIWRERGRERRGRRDGKGREERGKREGEEGGKG